MHVHMHATCHMHMRVRVRACSAPTEAIFSRTPATSVRSSSPSSRFSTTSGTQPAAAIALRQLFWSIRGQTTYCAPGRVCRSAWAEDKAAQTSASWLSGGLFQRQIVPQAAPSFGQPRLAGHTGLVFHKAVHDPRWEEQQLARARVVHEAVGGKRRPHTTRVVEGDWPR